MNALMRLLTTFGNVLAVLAEHAALAARVARAAIINERLAVELIHACAASQPC